MNRPFLLAAVAAMVLGGPAVGDNKAAGPRQLRFELRVCEGDPLGSQEDGTMLIRSQLQVITLENQPFSTFVGGQIAVQVAEKRVHFRPVGQEIKCKPSAIKGGEIQLDLTYERSSVGGQVNLGDQMVPAFNVISLQTRKVVKVGELVRLRLEKTTGDKDVWVELKVEESKP
jgi:hypothetical protein